MSCAYGGLLSHIHQYRADLQEIIRTLCKYSTNQPTVDRIPLDREGLVWYNKKRTGGADCSCANGTNDFE